MTTKQLTYSPKQQAWRLPVLTLLLAVVWFLLWQRLQAISDWLTYDLMRLEHGTQLAESVNFFLYDVPKIMLLLSGMIFLVTIIQSFFSPERARAFLGGKREGVGNIMAAGLGVLTPFCSCSAVPMFIGFVKSGIPLGVTFSFLIATPVVNEIALAMLFGLFGIRVAALYLVSGLLIAVVGGVIIGRLHPERYVADFVWKIPDVGEVSLEQQQTWDFRIRQAAKTVREIVSKVWIYVLIGIAIGAAIHGYVPEDFLVEIMGKGAWWSVPVAVILGVPLYSNAAGIIPIVFTMMEKGAALGTVLAFMMSVVALSFPEMMLLKRVLHTRLIMMFIGIVAVSIML
ncbi:MAG TPA: permease, partial [Anaerolineae bacterium]|nr:permease [Anaerolineae bacterium]